MYNGKVTNYFTKQPMAGVKVSDGMNIVLTDEEGRFSLPGWERAHVINVGLLTECHDDWYINIEGHKGDFDFVVKPTECGDNFCFMHMSDSEIEGRSKNDWIDFVRKTVKEEKPAFFVNTGDLCREDGLNRHYLLMNSDSAGCPVRYTIGNHDLCDGDYGEQLYEKKFGPTWFSFDCGKVHFVFLNIGSGDKSSGYPGAMREKWLINDLAMKDDNKAVIMLCHHFNPVPEGGGHTAKRMAEFAGDKGLKALIFGHDHMNYVYEYESFIGMCSARPDSGGIDSSPAGARKIIVRGTDVSTEYLYNIPEASAVPDKCDWQTQLDGNVEFSSPIEIDGAVWVCTMDDGYPTKSGIYKLDADNGKILAFIKTGSIKGDAAYCDGKLYAVDTSGTLYCVDTQNGKLLWTIENKNEICYTRKGVVIAGDKVVIARIVKTTTKVCAYNKDSGEFVWMNSFKGDNCPSRLVFDEKKNQILIGAQWSGLFALSADNGEKLWENGNGAICWFNSSTPVLGNDIIWKKGNVEFGYLDAQTGETLKSISTFTSLDVSGGCAFDDDTVYVPTVTAGVIGFDKETLEHKKTFSSYNARMFTAPYYDGSIQTVETTPVILGEKLIFAASDGYIHIYNKNTGASLRKINVGNPVIASPIVKKDYIITADFSGKIKKFRI